MSGPAKPVSGAVLRNKGVPLTLHSVTETDDGTYARLPGDEEVHVRMTNGTLADLEDRYGSMDEWQTALTVKPYSAIRETLALILDRPKKALDEAMIEGQIGTYSTVVGAAFMLANGVDADAVGKVLAAGLRDEDRRRVILTEETVNKVIEAIDAEDRVMGENPTEPATTGGRTRGTSGSGRGRAQAEASSSSGT